MGLKHVSPSGDRFDESVVPRTSPEHLDAVGDLGGVAQSVAKKLSVERAHVIPNIMQTSLAP